ncbi:hypothetical protein [Nonomuraea endophytica]|uniref:hypothetical protein n=1 Tax=Nonomuraea endophytica TaxID=714136 RepID=UPI0037C71EE9
MNARGQALPGPGENEIESQHRRRYGVIEPLIADVFGYHSPPDRPAVLTRTAKTRSSSPRSTRLSETSGSPDVRCKEKTGLVSIWAAAETRVQNDAIRAHPKKFQELRAVKVRQLAAARRILS